MAQAIYDAFSQSKDLIVEAGTGVGKTFAYLVGALKHALDNDKKVVISTYTIALQEQLCQKDIPFIKKTSGKEFTAILAKGRGNYLCMKRLRQAQKYQTTLFDSPSQLATLDELFHWGLQTQDGSLSELPKKPPMSVWETVCSDANSCQGSACNRNSDCFYQRARRKLHKANLIITNHALLFTDLALRQEGGSILPDYQYVILDEAHNIENIAAKHFGLRLSSAQVNFLFNRLFNPKNQKGLLASRKDKTIIKLLSDAQQSADTFFNELFEFYHTHQRSGSSVRVMKPNAFTDHLTNPLKSLSIHLQSIIESVTDEQDRLELAACAKRCIEFANKIEIFITQTKPDGVYWIETTFRRTNPVITLCISPIQVGPSLQKSLYDPCSSTVLTSATLSTCENTTDGESNNGFGYFASQVGLDPDIGLQLGSPFDYPSQVTIFLESHLPDPKDPNRNYLSDAIESIKKYLLKTQGKALILFTSYSQLQQMFERLEDFCAENNLTLLKQGKSMNRSRLLNEFRRNQNSVLLGTDSFWQGIDVPGESLSNLMIAKLPFSVPDEPLLQARLEQIRINGGNPFFDYQLPEAILKFKQGFGRLIRTKQDKGIVVILDPRITKKPYGKKFLDALPPCPIENITEP